MWRRRRRSGLGRLKSRGLQVWRELKSFWSHNTPLGIKRCVGGREKSVCQRQLGVKGGEEESEERE